VEKYSRPGQATGDIIRRMRFAYWVIKATDTHSEYVILIAVYSSSGFANVRRLLVYVHCLSWYEIHMIRYICQLQLGKHPVAVVQYIFTRKQYIKQQKKKKNT
jgi:hypothetical protein